LPALCGLPFLFHPVIEMVASPKEKKPTFDPNYIRNLSEAVYRIALNRDSGEGAVERMIAKDKDGGEKLRNRAAAYDKLTRAYLEVLGVTP
jgi:hypothetical protein